MTPGIALLIGAALLLLNATFVSVEFALVAGRDYKLAQRAGDGSRAARAALRGMRELSLMLAGTQLGITLCTLGLGALAEPALGRLLHPAFEVLGVPGQLAHILGLIFGVAIVVLLHMVLGEMVPKSWTISHPERTAVALALPFRGFARLARPALLALNSMANGLVRLTGVTPVSDNDTRLGPTDMQVTLARSREHRKLAPGQYRRMAGALRLEQTRLIDRVLPMERVVTIDVDAACAEVERISRQRGRSRLVVSDRGRPIGIVHVHDALLASAHRSERPCAVRSLLRRIPTLPGSLPLIDAVAVLRSERAQLALVTDTGGELLGITAMEDLLEEVLGQFEDETDARAR